MRIVLGGGVALMLSVAMIPAVVSNGDEAPPRICSVVSGSIEVILATIRDIESGGDYTAQSRTSTASGAYQIINATWNGHGGYARANEAPPEVQDAKAAEMVVAILHGHAGDVSAVPVVWYLGHLPRADSPEWSTVPAGNALTPRQYQARWMASFRRLTTRAERSNAPGSSAPPAVGPCLGGGIEPVEPGWSLPGPRHLIDADPTALTQPHHDYPAWDWIVPTGTPIYAIRTGTVARLHLWPHNWWERDCNTHASTCDPCGIGITIVDNDNTRWTYCHGTNLTATIGDRIEAGQQIMWSGNTGRSGTPHLHLQITADGILRCPQPLLIALVAGELRSPSSLPTEGCFFRT